ncbi:GTP binding protein [Babesia ovis]|uniref:GTP binding protein n=1 Tax=Babesia ovis TaxID=5869 RepID=A0A9W5WW32_BABOV|nr:GTP binding protein [Babesia ovis]
MKNGMDNITNSVTAVNKKSYLLSLNRYTPCEYQRNNQNAARGSFWILGATEDDHDITEVENEYDSELEIEEFIQSSGGWDTCEDGSGKESYDAMASECGQSNKNEATPTDTTNSNQGLSYKMPEGEEDDKDYETLVPFRLKVSGEQVDNLLSKRVYVKKLFKRIPQISDTKSILVRSKAHVKGKVGSREELAMGNSNKIKTVDTMEEPVYDGKPLYAGVYNGLTPCKHTRKRIIREIKVKVDWYAHSITHQIKNVITFYEQLLRYIHPFQYQMLMTTIYDIHNSRHIKTPFNDLMEVLKAHKIDIINRANNFNSKIPSVRKCREAFALAKAFILQLDKVYMEAETCIDIYRKFSKEFRKLPVIDISKPIVAIVGYVNVGKSTLFRDICNKPMRTVKRVDILEGLPKPMGKISDVLGLRWQEHVEPTVTKCQGEVKIADYNFSTKSIAVADIQYRVDNFIGQGQLIDTPALLWRDKPKTNPYEKLTYAALKDLPSGVIYCFDLSDPSILENQIKLYRSLESRFPHRPWINVVTKGHDLKPLTDEGIDVVPNNELMERLYAAFNNLDGLLKSQQDLSQEDDDR